MKEGREAGCDEGAACEAGAFLTAGLSRPALLAFIRRRDCRRQRRRACAPDCHACAKVCSRPGGVPTVIGLRSACCVLPASSCCGASFISNDRIILERIETAHGPVAFADRVVEHLALRLVAAAGDRFFLLAPRSGVPGYCNRAKHLAFLIAHYRERHFDVKLVASLVDRTGQRRTAM